MKCYFCGEESVKKFEVRTETGEIKQYPVCEDCDGPDLHEGGGKDMTGTKLTEIREALAKATPGPWKVIMEDMEDREYHPACYLPASIKSKAETIIDCDGINLELKECIPNAELIANAPEWLTYLLDQNESLQQQVNTLTEALEKIEGRYASEFGGHIGAPEMCFVARAALQSIKEQP